MFPLHITHLAACAANVSNLDVYQSLVECHLQVQPWPDFFLPYDRHLPNVRHLFVSSALILAHLFLPSLNNLMVYGHDTPEIHTTIIIVNDLIYRSHCSLTRLATNNLALIDKAFVKDCLLSMDTLVYLEIVLLWDVEDIFNALSSLDFFPNLQHLTLQMLSFIKLSLWKSLTAMMNSRSQYLRSFRILCAGSDNVEMINKRLGPQRPPGLQLIVSMRGNNDGTSSLGYFESG
ncbi:hypothetical protein F5146DRAFT_1136755 [Armillaria mellea]|nr:hypothetical protein F5146DRAFT_1136755 [Armillaria mellea]